MKSKWTTYILLAVVIAIWGAIAWRMLYNRPKNIEPATPSRQEKSKSMEPDTLFLDYADPFLGKKLDWHPEKAVKNSTAIPLKKKVATKSLPPKVEHNIKYIGILKKNGVPYCLSEINGEYITLATGEIHGEYKLIFIHPDSASFMMNSEAFTIKHAQ